ncbi:HNH endonuclease [Microcella sp.]|uniref:HNH endonuclease n=1 Tax=Microcella sp. TaxID=1913979 RepID=UPI002569DCAC|nr:HNH endonuclease signature motif containing protein [Microcella sp.]MBX9470400.1 HNH endonuclease [Microcella sp.]
MVHPNSRQARAARRRRKRVAAVDNDLTSAEWALLQQLWGGCAYCGATDRPLQRDCVQPIARGGRYTIDNIVPACGSCNASKSNNEVTSWMRRTRRDERAFLERLVVVRAALESAVSEG